MNQQYKHAAGLKPDPHSAHSESHSPPTSLIELTVIRSCPAPSFKKMSAVIQKSFLQHTFVSTHLMRRPFSTDASQSVNTLENKPKPINEMFFMFIDQCLVSDLGGYFLL